MTDDRVFREPTFREPWEAKAFALAVELNRAGLFGWGEWAEALGAEIAAAGGDDDGSHYYQHWLRALEKLVVAKGAATVMALADAADGYGVAGITSEA